MKTMADRSRDHKAKLKREGWKRISLWLAPADAELLKRTAKTAQVSSQEALRLALREIVK